MSKQRQDREAKLLTRESQARSKEHKRSLADERTELAEKEIALLEQTLSRGIDRRTEDVWDKLKDSRAFPKPRPEEPYLPVAPYIPDPALPTLPRNP